MHDVLDALSPGWIGTVLGVAGILLAYYFYREGQPVARLSYTRSDVTVVGTSPTTFSSDLEIRFAGKPVPRVTASHFIIWNRGNTTIHGSDIVERDPLRVEVTNGRILRAHMISVSRTVIEPAATPIGDQASASISFDFLDPTDGFAIQVLHTDEDVSCGLAGTIRGMKGGIVDHEKDPRTRLYKLANIAPIIWLMLVAMIMLNLLSNANIAHPILRGWINISAGVSFFVFSAIVATWLQTLPAKLEGRKRPDLRQWPLLASLTPGTLTK